MADTTKLLITITEAQAAAIEQAAQVASTTKSQATRDGMRWFCEQHGIEWPDRVLGLGEHWRIKKQQEAEA